MAIPTTRQCFFGCSLRNGVLILAYWGLIVAVLGIIELTTKEDMPDSGKSTCEPLTGTSSELSIITKFRCYIREYGIFANGILSALLLLGVYMESRLAILCVVYTQLAGIILYTIFLIISSIIIGEFLVGTIFTIWVLTEFIHIMAVLYFTWVEYSYAEELKDKATNPHELV